MLLGVTSPAIAPRILAARDPEERNVKWSEGMKPRFFSWNVAAMYAFDFSFPDAWSRKKIKTPPSRKPYVYSNVWRNVYTPADDLSRLRCPGEIKMVLLEVAKKFKEGMYMTVDELVPSGDESVEFLVATKRQLVLSRRGSDPTGTAGLGHGHAPRSLGTWAKTRHK